MARSKKRTDEQVETIPHEVEMVDNVPEQIIEPPVFPEVVVPEDFDI